LPSCSGSSCKNLHILFSALLLTDIPVTLLSQTLLHSYGSDLWVAAYLQIMTFSAQYMLQYDFKIRVGEEWKRENVMLMFTKGFQSYWEM